MKKYLNTPCCHCGGTGRPVDGAWLRHKRTQAGLTLANVSDLVKCTTSYLSEIERGKRRATMAITDIYSRLQYGT